MVKIVFTILFLATCICSFAQNVPKATNKPPVTKVKPPAKGNPASKDTVMESDTSKENKEPRYFYVTFNSNVFVNSKGGFAKRYSPSVEFGRTYGLATGKLNSLSSGSDTSQFIEFRPTINIFSKGRFAEALCLGGGYVFGAQQALMTEICNSINFNINANWAVAVVQGYFYFDGTNSSRNTQYMGLNVTYNFLRSHSVNKQRKKATLISDN
jgi:hypothetical protein